MTEEDRGRTATILAAPVSRLRWLAGRVVVVATGTGAMLAAVGAALSASAVPGLVEMEEHTSELQSHSDLVCRLLLEKKKTSSNCFNN